MGRKIKIWLTGITQNKVEDIDALTKNIHQHFDGLVFVDAGSTDGTKEILEERKGSGKIIYRKWTNDHDFQMNEFLRQGPIKNGDWFVIKDSQERLNENFCKNLRPLISQLESNQIQSCYWYSKGLMFKFYDDMYFQGSPHWGLQGARQKAAQLNTLLNTDEDSKTVTWGERNRSEKQWAAHNLKYYWCYGRSNHQLLGRENDLDGFMKAENDRVLFRLLCEEKFGVEFTIESIHEILKNKTYKQDRDLDRIVNEEPILQKYIETNL